MSVARCGDTFLAGLPLVRVPTLRTIHRMDLESRVRGALRRGEDDEATTLAIEALGPGVLGYLAAMLRPDDARDAFSLWAEDVWKGLPGFRWECTLKGWAYRIAWRAAARQTRDRFRARAVPLGESLASRLAESVVTRSSLMSGGRRDRLAQLRAQLDPVDRTILVLRIDRELEWDEVAVALSDTGVALAAPALRKRFERLKERLAVLAREQGMLGD